MKFPSRLSLRSGHWTVILLLLGVFVFLPTLLQAGSLVIPAGTFARGNVRIDADPDRYADAGPVVVSGPAKPWGWTVEYDIDIPVTAQYTLQICYASAEARPVEVFFDNQDMGKCCLGVTFASTSSGLPADVTGNSSGVKWEGLRTGHAWRKLQPIGQGKHTLKIARSGPLPHLVALRLDTQAAFPEDWTPPRLQVRDIDSVPAAYREAVSKVAVLPPPLDDAPQPRAAGSLTSPAWSFKALDLCRDAGFRRLTLRGDTDFSLTWHNPWL